MVDDISPPVLVHLPQLVALVVKRDIDEEGLVYGENMTFYATTETRYGDHTETELWVTVKVADVTGGQGVADNAYARAVNAALALGPADPLGLLPEEPLDVPEIT